MFKKHQILVAAVLIMMPIIGIAASVPAKKYTRH